MDEALNINKDSLQDLLSRRKHHFKSFATVIETSLCFISFIVSLFLSNISECSFPVKIAVGILSLSYLVLAAMNIYGSNYSADAFFRDICSTADNDHSFSILVFKDTSGTYPASCIYGYDKRWKCWLFPYIRTNTKNDLESVKNYVSSVFKLKDFAIERTEKQDFTKRSVSANLTKTYHHTFYLISFDASGQKQTFKANNEKYRWLTMQEIKSDKKAMERNFDNIEYVEKTF